MTNMLFYTYEMNLWVIYITDIYKLNSGGRFESLNQQMPKKKERHFMLSGIGIHDIDDFENSILLQIFINEVGWW